jgi:signal peptidase I
VATKKKRASSASSTRSRNVVSQAKSGGVKGSDRSSESGGWREFLKGLIPIVVIFLVLRTFFVEAYRIPSESMVPSLLIGDFLFVNKLVYGPHIPFTNVNLPGYGHLQRGDIAVYESPPQYDQPWDLTPIVVKRIVAIEGDTIYMRGGLLYVNGIAQRLASGPQVPPPGFEAVPRESFEWMRKFALRGSRFGPPVEHPTLIDWGPMVVPVDHFFSMGDNRYNSKDARFYGFPPEKNLRGQPMFIYFSYDRDGSTSPVPFLTDIRWGRLGHWIR